MQMEEPKQYNKQIPFFKSSLYLQLTQSIYIKTKKIKN